MYVYLCTYLMSYAMEKFTVGLLIKFWYFDSSFALRKKGTVCQLCDLMVR